MSESDVYRRQIVTCKVNPRADRVKYICMFRSRSHSLIVVIEVTSSPDALYTIEWVTGEAEYVKGKRESVKI